MNLAVEKRQFSSPFVDYVWHTRSEDAGIFTSMANPNWEMVVMKRAGEVRCTLRGPETKATSAEIPPDAEFLGIVFKPGAFIPHLPLKDRRDRQDLDLPLASDTRFWLKGGNWQVPDFENVDVFVSRLVRQGVLVCDPLVEDVLGGFSPELSLRSVQRRFLRATGITQHTYLQIERAYLALDLLEQGKPILETTFQLGYADQPHLTRSLQRYMGQTPGQISTQGRTGEVSFLFKTYFR